MTPSDIRPGYVRGALNSLFLPSPPTPTRTALALDIVGAWIFVTTVAYWVGRAWISGDEVRKKELDVEYKMAKSTLRRF